MGEQLELDFTSECPEEARELGIRWAPRDATPEETKKHRAILEKTENKLSFVGLALIRILSIQFNFPYILVC